MPVNGFNVGRDIALDVITPNGPFRFSLITGFTSKPDYTEQKIKGLDGITRHVRFHDGWAGSFDVERQDNQLDAYFQTLEDNYYSGQNENACTITETISEVNGSISQYRYVGVLLKLDDRGNWAGDATVKQKMSFVAARRVKA